MLFRSTLLALASVASLANTQTVDPKTVDEGTRGLWFQQYAFHFLVLGGIRS